jgi:pimeloyl-ACP methyl ester carboxylesterase
VNSILVGPPILSAEWSGLPDRLPHTEGGLTALLLVGFGAGGLAWQSHAEAFRRLIPDNRGVGASLAPSGPYKTAQMADDCARVLEASDGPVFAPGGRDVASTPKSWTGKIS